MDIPKSEIVDKSFAERLRYGQETEALALEAVQGLYDPNAYATEGLDKAKDIVAPASGKKFEVKDQRNAVVCLPVEYARIAPDGTWRYSGIKTTKSDYWIWYCKGDLLVIETAVLYEIAKAKVTTIKPHRGEKYAFKVVTIKEVRESAEFIWILT